jgi:transcriptional regulator with XRE-family HTH domain
MQICMILTKKQVMVGQRIRTIRTKKGISQEYLAEQLGLTQSTLARIEQGKAKLAASLVPALCKTLEVEIEEIFSSEKVNIENNTFNDSSMLNGYVGKLIMDQKELYEKLLVEKDRVIALLEAQLAKK